jgi:hypothetical protein
MRYPLCCESSGGTPQELHGANHNMSLTQGYPIAVHGHAPRKDRPAMSAQAGDADGIFMTGGGQKRLRAIIGGTALDAGMHAALKLRGACTCSLPAAGTPCPARTATAPGGAYRSHCSSFWKI